jgi:D-alanine-D-alanine ligase
MPPLNVCILYNEPTLPPDDPDWASEAGVLESVEAVEQSLAHRGHLSRRLGFQGDVATLWNELTQPASANSPGRPDVIVNFFEGLGGRGEGESQVTGLLDLSGIPYTGSSLECLTLVRDKARTKWMLLGAGLPTAAFEYLSPYDPLPVAGVSSRVTDLLDKHKTLIVKPAHEDASLGISTASVVHDFASLLRQIELVRFRYGEVLVEQFISGREFNVGILSFPEPKALPLAEIEFASHFTADERIVTYEAKWAPESAADIDTPPICPANVEPALASEIERIALAAYRLTGCRDYARVDLRVGPDNHVYVLEVNGNPDIGPSAGLARAVRVSGLTYDDFVVRLVEQAYTRRHQELSTTN